MKDRKSEIECKLVFNKYTHEYGELAVFLLSSELQKINQELEKSKS